MRHLARRLGRNDGFTIIELLMAIMTGVVVTGALYAILEVSLRQTSRVTDRVQATQLGRIAMTNVVDELHSTCLARKFAPVQEKSTAKELIFINGTGEEALLSSSKVFKHKIYWGGTYPNPLDASSRDGGKLAELHLRRLDGYHQDPRRIRLQRLGTRDLEIPRNPDLPTTSTPKKRERARAPPRRGRWRR